MRTTAVMGIIVVAISLAMGTRAEAQVSLRPGRTNGSTKPGGRRLRPAQGHVVQTPEDAKDVKETIAAAGKETNCKVSDVKDGSRGKLIFTMTCKDPDGVSTYTNDVTAWTRLSYTNVSKGKTA